MKLYSESHQKRAGELRSPALCAGCLLFTVLAVMFVMIIVVMTTITLAGIASKKAYSNWFDNQPYKWTSYWYTNS